MSEPIFKDITEFTEKTILGDNDFVPISATEKINLKKHIINANIITKIYKELINKIWKII